MQAGLDCLNVGCKPFRLGQRNDTLPARWYLSWMAKPGHDWFLKEWLRTLHKKQADVARDLDWNKARVSLMIRGEQQYTRDAVNELAAYLNLRPYELLMHPDEAMRLRRLREDAISLAYRAAEPESEEAEQKVSLG
jgi:plasmid maintenance system antidote protein VapI